MIGDYLSLANELSHRLCSSNLNILQYFQYYNYFIFICNINNYVFPTLLILGLAGLAIYLLFWHIYYFNLSLSMNYLFLLANIAILIYPFLTI